MVGDKHGFQNAIETRSARDFRAGTSEFCRIRSDYSSFRADRKLSPFFVRGPRVAALAGANTLQESGHKCAMNPGTSWSSRADTMILGR
jgi:hypothetical protein